jgi:hypothetical protein
MIGMFSILKLHIPGKVCLVETHASLRQAAVHFFFIWSFSLENYHAFIQCFCSPTCWAGIRESVQHVWVACRLCGFGWLSRAYARCEFAHATCELSHSHGHVYYLTNTEGNKLNTFIISENMFVIQLYYTSYSWMIPIIVINKDICIKQRGTKLESIVA